MSFSEALERMPQKGVMLLIDEVLAATEDSIVCRASDHRRADYPLRIAGELMPVTLVELGAQASAAHASLYGIGGHHAGLLLALHKVEILKSDGDLSDSPLEACANRLYFDESGARYRFTVRDQTRDILVGEAMLMMQAIEL
jgi:predicted hotdog family 3-hydroxylacyl-ACP dehydratase